MYRDKHNKLMVIRCTGTLNWNEVQNIGFDKLLLVLPWKASGLIMFKSGLLSQYKWKRLSDEIAIDPAGSTRNPPIRLK